MAVSALLPLASKEDVSPIDREALLFAVREIQYLATATTEHPFTLLNLLTEELKHSAGSEDLVLRRASKLVIACRNNFVHSQTPANSLDAATLRAFNEAISRWSRNSTAHGKMLPLSAASETATPPEIRQIVRDAFRTLKANSLRLFCDTWWRVTEESVEHSDTFLPGAIKTAYGISTFNVDLALEQRLAASNAEPLLGLAHDLRWYASIVVPSRARATNEVGSSSCRERRRPLLIEP